MHHADKTVTVYHRQWDPEKGADIYKGTVLKGVSFFCKVCTTVTTDGLTAANEAVLRIPEEVLPEDLKISNGDLVCEGDLPAEGMTPAALSDLTAVFAVVGIIRNLSGREPHVKVICR